jgi:hypothetical protein
MRHQDRSFPALSVAFAMQSGLALTETPPTAPIEPPAAPPSLEPALATIPPLLSLSGFDSSPLPILSASAGLPGSRLSPRPTFHARAITAYETDCRLHRAGPQSEWAKQTEVLLLLPYIGHTGLERA